MLVCIFSAGDAIADSLRSDGYHIFNATNYEIAQKQMDGCISPKEAAKLNLEMSRINKQNMEYGQHQYEKTGVNLSRLEPERVMAAEARKIFDYLQTKTVVNEKWKSPYVVKGPRRAQTGAFSGPIRPDFSPYKNTLLRGKPNTAPVVHHQPGVQHKQSSN